MFDKYPKNIANTIALLEQAVATEAFTAWSFANKGYAISAFWASDYSLPNKKKLCLHPNFDLASLTKPLFINLYLILKYGELYPQIIALPLKNFLQYNNCALNLPSLQHFIEENPALTLNSFLSHQTPLARWCWMGKRNAIELTDFILTTQANLSTAVYSDLNYFILARIIESLENFSWENIIEKINSNLKTDFKHAGLHNSTCLIPYFPYYFSNKPMAKKFGLIHDTNANILSGYRIISGHSGLIANVMDIMQSIKYLYHINFLHLLYKEKIKSAARFIFGFDTPAKENSAVTLKFPAENINKVFGHLAYTGCSFWMHTRDDLFQILLTNRTAHRTNTLSCPRIYVVQELDKPDIAYFIRDRQAFYQSSHAEVLNAMQCAQNNYEIAWNESLIPNYKDLLAIRQKVGFNLWSL